MAMESINEFTFHQIDIRMLYQFHCCVGVNVLVWNAQRNRIEAECSEDGGGLYIQ